MEEIKHTPELIQKFDEVTVCKGCGEKTHEVSCGDEGWTVCDNCGVVEGATGSMFECSLCWSLCDDEKCDCIHG